MKLYKIGKLKDEYIGLVNGSDFDHDGRYYYTVEGSDHRYYADEGYFTSNR